MKRSKWCTSIGEVPQPTRTIALKNPLGLGRDRLVNNRGASAHGTLPTGRLLHLLVKSNEAFDVLDSLAYRTRGEFDQAVKYEVFRPNRTDKPASVRYARSDDTRSPGPRAYWNWVIHSRPVKLLRGRLGYVRNIRSLECCACTLGKV